MDDSRFKMIIYFIVGLSLHLLCFSAKEDENCYTGKGKKGLENRQFKISIEVLTKEAKRSSRLVMLLNWKS